MSRSNDCTRPLMVDCLGRCRRILAGFFRKGEHSHYLTVGSVYVLLLVSTASMLSTVRLSEAKRREYCRAYPWPVTLVPCRSKQAK
jgi:hypothetical protein